MNNKYKDFNLKIEYKKVDKFANFVKILYGLIVGGIIRQGIYVC